MLEALIVIGVASVAAYHLAKNRGHDPVAWAMIAAVCPLAIVVLACLKDRNIDAKLEQALRDADLTS